MVVLSDEVLADARDLAAAFADAAALPGWLPQEHAALETASTAIWKAIAVVLHDRNHPAVRQRRARAAETRIAPPA